ncbi:ATP:cob(I)alamin adenosyltransferase [Vulcanisaeta sp. JCM 16159]|uniref:ATP:cob(I)alamin adenosyltransferase n=1 Tax=Vulcanisaeta sp. JCM 16159 TaxID=1295371 RepID=UPI0006D1898E|nr:cobalamin adenosyltransferase [Vulcanisaeta sp. JCM 16159]
MTNVFVDCLRIDGSIKCPGDGGFSEVIVFGKHVRLRKDHPAIELMGRLDELEALAEWGLQEIGGDKFRAIAAMTAALNTYLATGDSEWLKPVRDMINKACELDSRELGWFIPSDKTTALLNLLRVKAREAERTAVKLLDDDYFPINNVNELIGMLNQLNKYIAHLIFLSNVHVFKNVNDKIRTLLGINTP